MDQPVEIIPYTQTLDLQNNRVKPGCYQIVIKGYFDPSKTVVLQRYLKADVLFPLAPGNRELNDFV